MERQSSKDLKPVGTAFHQARSKRDALLVAVAALVGIALFWFAVHPTPRGATPRASGGGPVELKHPLWWFGPIWSGTGYGSEAIEFVLALAGSGLVRPGHVWAANHGGLTSGAFIAGMAPADRAAVERAELRPLGLAARNRSAVVVCHSMPYFWSVPSPQWPAGVACPPNRTEHPWVFAVGRTMYETHVVPGDFAERCNAMDEVWVPSEWQRDAFAASGVDPKRIRVVPEGVDTDLFDPSKHRPLDDLEARAKPVFGPAAAAGGAAGGGNASVAAVGAGAALGRRGSAGGGRARQRPFRFLSTFKWEARKGWDVLLEAWLSEFGPDEGVELVVLTKPWDDTGGNDGAHSFAGQMQQWASKHVSMPAVPPAARASQRHRRLTGSGGLAPPAAVGELGLGAGAGLEGLRRSIVQGLRVRGRLPLAAQGSAGGSEGGAAAALDPARLPALRVIDAHLDDADFLRLYASADAFVLPSRGEGWGRPHVEAMSMGLPVIATNWSGVTAYLDDSVGYPIAIEGLVRAEGWRLGLKWAQPSVAHLRSLMRRVFERRSEARARGAAARRRVVERYSRPAIAAALLQELLRIEARLPAGG